MPLFPTNPPESFDAAVLSLPVSFYMPIIETSGTSIADTSGNGRTGTTSGTVTLNNATAPDGRPAALFGGGHIAISDHASLSATANGLTVGCLAKFNAAPSVGGMHLVAKGTTANYEWELGGTNTNGNGNAFLIMYTAAGVSISRRDTNTGAVGTAWTLLIGSAQNLLANNTIRFFKDSTTESAGTNSGGNSPYADGTNEVRIGARGDGAATVMAGYLRNVFMMPEGIDRGSVARLVAAAQREGWF